MARKRSDRPERQLVIFPGPAGWTKVLWRFQQPDEIEVYVRLEIRDDTFDAVEFRLFEPWLDRLREIPLRRIENAIRASTYVREMLRSRYEETEPDFSDESVFYFGPSQAERENFGAGAPGAFSLDAAPGAYAISGAAAGLRFKLSRPAKRRLPDEFYADVAIAYMAAVEAGLNPRKALAADSGTPADTVARWIGQARKRGHLPPGEPGKATA
jgi:hypothetical protein